MTWLQVEGDKVYAAHEVDSYEGVPGGAISRWNMTKTGLRKMESISLPTESPAHLLVSLEHGLAFEANYHGHTWTAVRMDDGRLGGISYHKTFGAGCRDESHPHQTVMDPGYGWWTWGVTPSGTTKWRTKRWSS